MGSSIRASRTGRGFAVTAGIATIALTLTACGGGDGDNEGSGDASSDEQITLKVATFNNFGYTDEFLAAYTEQNPHIKIEHVLAAKSEDARTNLTTKLAAGGEGLADIEAIEVDWLPELLQYPDLFVDLPKIDGRWADWKVDQATAPSGELIGYGTDIGPEAICYRADLFEAAGLPSDREGVAELLGGDGATWDKYFEVGKQFVASSDAAWYDSAMATNQGMVNQLEAAYEDPATGEAKDLETNTEIKAIYDQVLAASVTDGLSAGLEQWSPDWDAGIANGAFATMLCPGWMTGAIEQRAADVTGWDVADVFPNGGGNWGGSWLTVPASGAHTEEAQKLADWLTAPEQQVKAFVEAGTFPSQVDAQNSDEVQSSTNPFFNDAPTGAIFAARAQAITSAPFKGANYFGIHQAVQDAIKRVDVEKSADAATSWEGALATFGELGL